MPPRKQNGSTRVYPEAGEAGQSAHAEPLQRSLKVVANAAKSAAAPASNGASAKSSRSP